MNIEFIKSPTSADIDFLTEKINQETAEFGSAYTFAFFIRDKKGQIIAGCNGSIVFGCIYTDQLWVHPLNRRSSFGRKMMEQVHEYGRKNGCNMATVNTMSFQSAKIFYKKLGYEIDFKRHGYRQNSSCIFLKRNL